VNNRLAQKSPSSSCRPQGKPVFADFLWRLNKKSGAARGRNPATLTQQLVTLLCFI